MLLCRRLLPSLVVVALPLFSIPARAIDGVTATKNAQLDALNGTAGDKDDKTKGSTQESTGKKAAVGAARLKEGAGKAFGAAPPADAVDLAQKATALVGQTAPAYDPSAASKLLETYMQDDAFPYAKTHALGSAINKVMHQGGSDQHSTAAKAVSEEFRRQVREKREEKEREAAERPDDPDAVFEAAGMGLEDAQYGRSLRHAREAARLRPQDPRTHYVMARDLYELGDYKESVRSASEAIRRNPKDAPSWSARAAADFKLSDWRAAYLDAKQAVALDPQDHMAQTILAVSGRRLDETPLPDAKPLMASSPAGDGGAAGPGAAPDPPAPSPLPSGEGGRSPGEGISAGASSVPPSYRAQALYQQAANQLELGDYKAAAESATHSIALSPASPEPYAARATAENYLKDYPAAIQDASKSLELQRANPQALNARSWAYNQTGKPQAALQDAEAAQQLSPRDASAFLNKAIAEESLGRLDDMEQDYQAAAELDAAYQPVVDAASQRFEEKTGRPFRTPAAAAAHRHSGRRPSRWTLSAAALVAGIGGGFLLALLWASSKSAPARPDAQKTTATPGAIIGGCYQVAREIGRGGMGIVYEADDLALSRKVALKRMKEDLRARAADKDRFLEEARTVAALRHPNIVEIFSIFEEGDDLYLVFEFVPGMSLDEHLYRQKKLGPLEARDILKPVCEALAYAHAHKVIHRDLKPGNIMLAEDGSIKVMDFGLARQAKDTLSHLTRADAAGTPAYMAPEMERGLVRKESDLYMLGGVLYEMLTGQPPFLGEDLHRRKLAGALQPPSHLAEGLPPALDAVIAKAMAPDPEQRYKSPSELLSAYDEALAAAKSL